MGVTYKLTEEVINFIIASKKQDMSLSCRTLSELASEKYQSKISKSSVNEVLKSAQLSSSVGRRSGDALKFKKFSIPKEKKEIIRQDLLEKTQTSVTDDQNTRKVEKKAIIKSPNIKNDPIHSSKIGATQEEIKSIIKNIEELTVKNPPINIPVQETNVPKEILKENDFPSTIIKNESVETPKAKPVIVHPIVNVPEKTSASIQMRERKGHLYNGMGFILLKAAEWEISDKPFLGNLFKKYVKGPWEKDFEKSCNALTILKMLGIEKLDDTFQYRYHALWRLSGFTEQPSFDKIYDWSKYLESPQNLIMEYMNECQQIFFEASGIQFTLEDHSRININASLSFLMENLDIQQTSIAMTKTLTLLSQFLISPEHMTVFHMACQENEFQKSFWDMVCAFENIPGKMITSIEILSGAHMKMADFPVVINKKRLFATGIAYWQKEFKELSKAVRWAPKKQFVRENPKRDFYFTDTQTNWFSQRLNLSDDHSMRLITFWQENNDEPFWMILTNNHSLNTEDIIFRYLQKWPDFNLEPNDGKSVIYQKHLDLPTSPQEIVLESVWDVFKDFGVKLHTYVQNHFQSENIPKYSINDYISDIYSLPGYLVENDKIFNVILSLPPSFKYYQDLLITLKKVNQSQVLNHDQRNIKIDIDY